MKKHTVHLASSSKEPTEFELFPAPEKVIKGWNEEMAERILPVAMFDLKMAGKDSPEKAFFIYYDDYACSFLSWKQLEDGMIEFD